MLVESIYTTQNPKEVGCTLMGAAPMVDYVVSGYPTHGKGHPPFYEGDYGNDHLPLLPMGKHLIRSTIPQGNSLRNVVPSPKTLHTGGRIYKVIEPTHLSRLRGSEGNVFEKGVKVRRPKSLAEKKRT